MKRVLAALLLAALPLSAGAVEKTAIDKRLSSGMDVELQSLQTFLDTLTLRIDKDLGTKISIIRHNNTLYDGLITDLYNRVDLLTTSYTSCPHSLAQVPMPISYPPNQKRRLYWNGASKQWQAMPLQSWE